MKSSEALDDAPIRDERLNLAERVPATMISAAAGTSEDAVRASGLFITKGQLIDLKRYETYGLALPTVLKDVILYLGYESGAGPSLDARDFQKTFGLIHQHALQWNPLRTDLMNVGSELWVFADQLLILASGVRQLYDEIKAKPSELYDPEDQSDFLQYVQQVAALVLQRRNSTESLQRRLDAFAQELSTVLMPQVQLKLRSIDTSKLPADIKMLIDTIKRRGDAIEQKQIEYKTLVRETSESGLVVPGLSLYNSTKANDVRKQIGALRQQQEASIALLEQKNRIHASLHRVRGGLHDMTLVFLDADIATQNMVSMWNDFNSYLNSAIEAADRIDSALSLRQLMNAFTLVAEPWVLIKRDADTLLNVFKEADQAFRKNYGHQ